MSSKQRLKWEIRIYLGNKFSPYIHSLFFPVSILTVYFSNPFISIHLSPVYLEYLSI